MESSVCFLHSAMNSYIIAVWEPLAEFTMKSGDVTFHKSCIELMFCCYLLQFSYIIILRLGKVLRKHSLHGENSSLSFIEAVRQWK